MQRYPQRSWIRPGRLLALVTLVCAVTFPNAAAATAQAAQVPQSSRTAPEAQARQAAGRAPARAPNELGRIPILEYHLFGDEEGRWQRSIERFREDLALLYTRGYRPITVSELVDGRIDLPAGLSPVVFTFDDASPSQFRYIEGPDGHPRIDPRSAVGVWLDFAARHSDWRNAATFCLLSNAEAGRAFFGNKGIDGQKSEWRHRKLRFLVSQGFELCNHTLWHANLAKYDGAVVREQIARANMAIDSAVPGYRVRTFALPLGELPREPGLARAGTWTDPASGRSISYRFDAILLVAGNPVPSPFDPAFNPLRLERVQVHADALVEVLDRLERSGVRYVSDGNPDTVTPARPRRVTP
ncbi:MAG: polysaccharide deacetylase family protein [Longimicrobiales bacterium]